MKIVAIESPFNPSEEEVQKYAGRFTVAELLRQNLVYARQCLAHALALGEAPCASHLLYTQVCSETPELRDAGINAGLEFYHRIDAAAHYVDLGRSSGMRKAMRHAELLGVKVSVRTLFVDAKGDPREHLSRQHLGTFPYLDELLAAERGSEGRLRVVT